MPRVTKRTDVKKIDEGKRALMGIFALAAQGGMIRRIEREGSQLKVTYRNDSVETFTFRMPWQAVMVVMVLKDMNTCVEQAKVTKVVKVLPEQRPK